MVSPPPIRVRLMSGMPGVKLAFVVASAPARHITGLPSGDLIAGRQRLPGCRAPVVANSGFECYLPVETPSLPQAGLRLYISRQASNVGRYVLEQALFALVGWIPSVVGVGLRAVLYRLILRMDGIAAIENGVRLRFADRISLGRNVYLDQGAYLHACPQGITLGDGTFVMHGAVLHVYNFRDLPHAFIRVGRDSLIGEYNVLRGQGGITIGDRVYTAPGVQILAVNHVYADPTRPMVEQGITAEGIVIEDDVWVGAGAIITDGVTRWPGRCDRRRRGGDRRRAAPHRRRRRPGPRAETDRAGSGAGSGDRSSRPPCILEGQDDDALRGDPSLQ